jgi:hypothetical protein
MSTRGSEERLETLIALARNNPQLATRLLAELPVEHRATLVAALARPPRKAVARSESGPGVAKVRQHAPSDAQSAYNAQLRAFARTISRAG